MASIDRADLLRQNASTELMALDRTFDSSGPTTGAAHVVRDPRFGRARLVSDRRVCESRPLGIESRGEATEDGRDTDRLLRAVLNMTAADHQHEEIYAAAPRDQAAPAHARAALALADGWTTLEPVVREMVSPSEGTEELNADVAMQLSGGLRADPAPCPRVRAPRHLGCRDDRPRSRPAERVRRGQHNERRGRVFRARVVEIVAPHDDDDVRVAGS